MNTPVSTSVKERQGGSALIGLVVAILIFSVLAAAIVPMTSSSGLQSSVANRSAKAYFLAESGFRYAASKYLHAGATESDKNDALEDLDGNYTLADGNSRFELGVYSYFYEAVNDIPSGATSFRAHTPGTFPQGDVSLDPGLQIQLDDRIYTLTVGSNPVFGVDDNVTMAVNPPMAFYPAGTVAYPVADADHIRTPSVSHGGEIAYQNNHGNMFPLRNGRISVNGRLLTYGFNDRANNQFVEVKDPEDSNMVSHTIPAGTDIVLTKFVRIQATGIYGSGPEQARREVTYHTPLPLSDPGQQRREITDRFDEKDDWTDTAGTTTSARDAGGNNALTVDSVATSGDDTGGLTAFDPSSQRTRAIDFTAASRGSRGFLSYDLQTKIGFESTPPPLFSFTPSTSTTPTYVAAGLNFRLADLPESGANIFNVNTYGLSIMRGNASALMTGTTDGIPDDLVPISDQLAIVLWQQTGNGANRTWLAYKEMSDTIFNEDHEDSANDQFTALGTSNLWEPNGAGVRSRSGSTRHWYYGRAPFRTYEWSGSSHSGTIESDAVALPGEYARITLKFWGWHETEPQRAGFDLNDFDRKVVRIVGSSGTTAHVIGDTASVTDWYQQEIDISAFAGQTIRIQFHFDTVDNQNNNYEGWHIDDVKILAEWPTQNATLAVGLQEAMVVRFSNGSPEIREGDRVYGNIRGTIGRVMSPPLLSSGDWSAGSPAQGTLFIDRVAVTTTVDAFDTNELLTVVGGTGRAEVASFDNARDRKTNIIRVFYANENGIGTPNTNPLDNNTRGYARLGANDPLQWPPFVNARGDWTDDDGNFTAEEDYFRLVQWDGINGDTFFIPFRANAQDIPQAVIQNHHDDLQTEDFPGTLSQTEVGLHAMGDGALNTYFDDFGIRIDVSQDNIVPAPLQQ